MTSPRTIKAVSCPILLSVISGCGKANGSQGRARPGEKEAEHACQLWRQAGVDYKSLGAEGALKLDEQAAALARDAARISGAWDSFANAADDFVTMVRATSTSSPDAGTFDQGYDIGTRGIKARAELHNACRALGVQAL